MTIDISKIRPGDKVTLVPLEVVEAGRGGYVAVRDASAVPAIFHPDQIAAHHPAPREFQVGDMVRYVRGSGWGVGTIESVARGRAWVWWGGGCDRVANLSDLTLLEDGE